MSVLKNKIAKLLLFVAAMIGLYVVGHSLISSGNNMFEDKNKIVKVK